MQYKELLIGCGANLSKKIQYTTPNWQNLTTLDINPDHHPNVIWDLENIPLPFEDNSFDEIHAYEVLEHTGNQGDYKFFFNQFSDFWRILRPSGLFIGTCPAWNGHWAWADPGHKRIIQEETLFFLDQNNYTNTSTMTDYRSIYRADFKVWQTFYQDDIFTFILKTNKR